MQVTIDVAIAGIDGQSRTSDEHTDRPLQVRHEQKKAKWAYLGYVLVYAKGYVV